MDDGTKIGIAVAIIIVVLIIAISIYWYNSEEDPEKDTKTPPSPPLVPEKSPPLVSETSSQPLVPVIIPARAPVAPVIVRAPVSTQLSYVQSMNYPSDMPIRDLDRSSVGKRCPCTNGAYCSKGKCLEKCFAYGRCSKHAPRLNGYYCNYNICKNK